MNSWVFHISVLVTYAACLPNQRHYKVSTNYGEVIGSVEQSRYGRNYDSYRGIPFAKPPVGHLRFKAPEPAEKWTSPLDATKEGPYCIQKNYFFANPVVEGQEDCLYLNVYVPQTDSEFPLPVMVFIHWGGFLAGRGTSDILHPAYFMDKDIILVTFNYRLGLFGFLSTLDDAAPGNYALKDQVLALKWVQENIEYFGGNKYMVTLFGQSAGAGSVHYHLLSPLSKGLFHRAISQSGSALPVWAIAGNERVPAVLSAQATSVNCSDFLGNSNELIKCLRNVPAAVLAQTQDLFKVFQVDPLTVYTTVTENRTENNPEPFFTKTPLEYIQDGEFQNVPWIIGTVQDEGIIKVGGYLRQSATREALNANFDMLYTNVVMGLQLSTNDINTLYNNLKEKYLLGNNFVNISDDRSIQGFLDGYSDRVFFYGSYQSAMLHSAMGHRPIWFYNFNYRGQYTYGDLFAATNETIDFKWGVSHCDDLLYLFKSPGLFPDLELSGMDSVVSGGMIDMWTNFAIYGEPVPPSCPNLSWPPVNIEGLDDMKNENLCVLNIVGSFEQECLTLNYTCGYYGERMKFWANQNLYENFGGLS